MPYERHLLVSSVGVIACLLTLVLSRKKMFILAYSLSYIIYIISVWSFQRLREKRPFHFFLPLFSLFFS